MKKIFTLLAATSIAFTVNAKVVLTEMSNNAAFGIPEDGKVSAWAWIQAATNDAQSHEEPEGSGNWITDKEATYDYANAADYDCVVITFDEISCDTKFFVPNGGWANQPFAMSVTGYKYAVLDMNAVGAVKDKIDAMVLQPTAEGVIKIKEIAYMTADEYAAFEKDAKNVTVTEDLALPGTNGVIEMAEGEQASGWYSPGWVGKSGLDATYKTLVFEVASATANYALMVQGSDDGSTWNDDGFTTFEVAAHTAPAIIALPVQGKHVNLGQFAFQNRNVTDTYPNEKGETVSFYEANTVTVTRIYLTTEVVESAYTSSDAIQNVVLDNHADNAMYNLAGQRVTNAKGIIIKNGIKFLAK